MFDLFKRKTKKPPKEPQDDVKACITYYVKSDGIPMVDIHMSDYDEVSIKGMEDLLLGISDADFFQDTIEMLKEGLLKSEMPDLFITIATKVAMEKVERKIEEHRVIEETLASTEQLLKGEDDEMNEEPYIKPSDIL